MTKPKTLVQIVGDVTDIENYAREDEFLKLVNQKPIAGWVQQHPLAKNVKFMPIGIIEALLTRIFQEWYVEVLREGVMANSIAVTIRLYYRHPITKKVLHQDGVGAVAIQTDAGKPASDLAAIKSDAIMKALPAAKSFAIKDAAEHIGKIFGRDINRKDIMAFSPSYSTEQARRKIKRKIQNADS